MRALFNWKFNRLSDNRKPTSTLDKDILDCRILRRLDRGRPTSERFLDLVALANRSVGSDQRSSDVVRSADSCPAAAAAACALLPTPPAAAADAAASRQSV